MVDWALGRFLMNTFGFQGAEAKTMQKMFQNRGADEWNDLTWCELNFEATHGAFMSFVELEFQLQCQMSDTENHGHANALFK